MSAPPPPYDLCYACTVGKPRNIYNALSQLLAVLGNICEQICDLIYRPSLCPKPQIRKEACNMDQLEILLSHGNNPRMVRQYRLLNKIGSGTFGVIFLGENVITGQRVALKLEHHQARHPQLLFEFKLYNFLNPAAGIPIVHDFFVEKGFKAMVMELLGPSLEDLFSFCSRRFSLKTVLMLAVQMIDRVEYVHQKNYVHRDIKPDNFAMGCSPNKNQLYIIDFGLSKRYTTFSDKHNHIPFKTGNRMTGTARYASCNALNGHEISRRDDMEALGYVFIYFLRGSLPWQGLTGPAQQKYEMLAEKKLSIKPEELCQDYPEEFAAYLIYCRSLSFEMQPDYNHLRRNFYNLFNRLRYTDDNVFDWNTIESLKKHNEDIIEINADDNDDIK